MAHGVHKTKHIQTRISLFKDWYKLIFPINRFISKKQILHLRSGEMVYVGNIFSSDVAVLMEVFYENTYHLEAFTLSPHAVICDIGANIGAFSVAVHTKWPHAHITAFEPSPRNFNLLQKNAPYATCKQEALAGASGIVHIQNEGTHTALKLVQAGGTEVKAVTLHEIIQDSLAIDLLKVDIEGAEDDVFEAAMPEDLAKIKNIIMEIHNPTKLIWYEDLFTKAGFSVDWVNPQMIRARRT